MMQVRSVVKIKRFQCSICGMGVVSEELLKRHFDSMHAEKGHVCELCPEADRKPMTTVAFKSHVRAVHHKVYPSKHSILDPYL